MDFRQDAEKIITAALTAAMPDSAVKKALEKADFGSGRLILVAVGKAAWQMSEAAYSQLGERIENGIVITKYGHSKGPIGNFRIFEAGHPIPDENSFAATDAAVELVTGLSEDDTVLFLLSGGGSALFEKSLIPAEDFQRLTDELLACGAEITEINTVRKRLSGVKGGRFALLCSPAKIFTIVLSDIIGDPLDMIASGPAYPDSSTSGQALDIAEKYSLALTDQMRNLLLTETPKTLNNVETHVTGSVGQLCSAAERCCRELGYRTVVLTSQLSCQAREAGTFLADIARYYRNTDEPAAFIAGGETVVKVTGNGKGGRNQELALSAAAGIEGINNAAVFSVGSDGTDGPTDAAGGYCDGSTATALRSRGIRIYDVLQNNDSYHALEITGGLIKTGPTGTNVNDLSVLLIKPE